MLQGRVNASEDLVTYGIDGSFYHLDDSKKNSGLKLKRDDIGITFDETISGGLALTKNDS